MILFIFEDGALCVLGILLNLRLCVGGAAKKQKKTSWDERWAHNRGRSCQGPAQRTLTSNVTR